MTTPKQKELILRLISLTKAKTVLWSKYNSPNSYVYQQGVVKYIVNKYKTISDEKQYDCLALVVIDDTGKIFENCVGCNAKEYVEDYNELTPLYNAIINQYGEDSQIESLLHALPA